MKHPQEILQIGDSRLEQGSGIIDSLGSKEVQVVIRKLKEVFLKYFNISAGLAAPQIGYKDSVCIVRRFDQNQNTSAKPVYKILINPKIEEASKETSTFWEGCLSVGWGEEGLFAPVNRPNHVKISYIDTNAENQTLEGSDFFAHVIQHEIDHLNGKLFLSYISDPSHIWKSKDLDKYIQKHGDYPQIN